MATPLQLQHQQHSSMLRRLQHRRQFVASCCLSGGGPAQASTARRRTVLKQSSTSSSSSISSSQHASSFITRNTQRPLPLLPGSRRHSRGVVVATANAASAVAAVAGSPWNTLAVLASCAAAAQAAEAHTSWGRLASAPLLTLLLALGAAAAGLLPPASPVYDAVWSHLMPLGVALILLDQDVVGLSSMRRVGGPVLAFLLGAGETES